MSNPFPTTVRPWLRITQAKRDLSTLILAPGDIAVTETGKQYIGDGVTQLKNLAQPGGAVASVAGKTGAVTLTKTDVGLGDVDNTTDLAKPLSTAATTALAGKADLVGGLIPTAQIPALALTATYVVASQAAMLALTATQVQPGDIAVRSDGAGTYVLTAPDPTQLANWVRLNAPTDVVTTVNGQQGSVVLAAADVGAATPASVTAAVAGVTKTSLGLGNVDNTADAAKPVSAAQTAAFTPNLTALPVATTSVAPTVGAIQPYSLGGGAFAPTLPALSALPTGSTYVGIQKSINDNSTNGVTVTCAGSDTFDSGATSLTLTVAGELRILQVVTISGAKRWKVISGNTPVTGLDSRYVHAVIDANGGVTLFQNGIEL